MAIVAAPKKGETKETCTRWRIVVTSADGKQDWTTIHGSRKSAEAAERRKRVAVEDGVYLSSRCREKFIDAAKAYISWLSTTTNKRGVPRSHGTIKNNRDLLNLYLVPKLMNINIQRISRATYEKEVAAPLIREGKSTDVLDRVAKVAKAVFTCAVDREVLKLNPLAGYSNKLIGATPRNRAGSAFTEDEVQAILKHAGRFRPLLMVMMFTGVRPGEALALQREDLDLDAGTVLVRHSWDFRAVSDELGPTGRPLQGRLKATKTGEQRLLPLQPVVVQALRDQLATHDHHWVFPSRDGRPHRQDNTTTWMKRILKDAGVPYRPLYSTRHTFASQALSANVAKHNVQKAMGHSGQSTIIERYAHGLPSGLREVADAVANRLAPATEPAPSPTTPAAKSARGKPKLRVIDGGVDAGIRNPLDARSKNRQSA